MREDAAKQKGVEEDNRREEEWVKQDEAKNRPLYIRMAEQSQSQRNSPVHPQARPPQPQPQHQYSPNRPNQVTRIDQCKSMDFAESKF